MNKESMMYANNSMKFTAVLNGKVSVPKLMNALGHITAGLSAELGREGVVYLDYLNEADAFRSRIAEAPFIVLKSKNGSQLASLRAAAGAAGIPHNTFVSAMVGASAAEQIATTRAAVGQTLEYWAILLFGEASKLDPLTRKFSLFNLSPPE
jgi:hypothetical protein